jgi:hypothetical protein
MSGMSLVGLVRPIAALLPDWMPAEDLLALLLVLALCFLVSRRQNAHRARCASGSKVAVQKSAPVFEASPRGWPGQSPQAQGATGEIEDALVPAFIIEELDDGQFTVFVPSVPTPLAGAVYVLRRERVHPLDVPFTSALQVVSKWGSGAKALVAAMKTAQADR